MFDIGCWIDGCFYVVEGVVQIGFDYLCVGQVELDYFVKFLLNCWIELICEVCCCDQKFVRFDLFDEYQEIVNYMV